MCNSMNKVSKMPMVYKMPMGILQIVSSQCVQDAHGHLKNRQALLTSIIFIIMVILYIVAVLSKTTSNECSKTIQWAVLAS